MLKYMEYTNAGNATNHDLQEIHRMIENVKYDAGVTGDYMRLMEDEDVLVERGIRQWTQQSIVDLLEEHAPVSEELVARIHAEGDLSILKTWLQYAAKSTSLEEFLEKIEQNYILVHGTLKLCDFGVFCVLTVHCG